MSPVLPIDTQRYQSGSCTLEVTAHRSSLSQWSDRPVVRRLRFSLWLEQPNRQRLAAGDQTQLVTLRQAVESYVQTHLTQQAWPQTHVLKLLDQELEFSTLQLFDLAEVLSASERGQITLPVTGRRRTHWWTGSAAASLLVAVGVTTAYLYYRPTAELATTQAPEAVFEEDEIPPTGFETAPETLDAPVVTEAAPGDSPEATAETELAAPADPPTTGSADNSVQPLEPVPPQTVPEEAVPEAPVPETSAPEAPVPETAVSEPPQTAPRADPPAELDAELFRDSGAADSSLATSSAEPARAETILAAIAADLAPYQPTDAAYPLVYHLQIAADGTILALEAVSNDAPTLDIPPLSISPGRPLRIELTYTGTAPPRVVELRQP
ncbi:MAG: DUF4335 domain-containing protein [Cyanobacteria bacterium P01_D01_bin.2]